MFDRSVIDPLTADDHSKVAGTGFEFYRGGKIPADEPPPPAPPQPTEDDLELDREMEYLIEPEEALGGGGRSNR